MGHAQKSTGIGGATAKGEKLMIDDATWMSLALQEAKKGIGKTAPNPPVGSVIVKDNLLLGSGWHHKAGMPHAEREAIADATTRHGVESLRGATAYVTLEPCSTQGRTPPCVQGLIDAGIARVVYSCEDPNPAHAGRADILLKGAGILVEKGVLQTEAEKILRPFAKVQRTGLPWVMVKIAMSLDGRITRPESEGQWLTGPASRSDVQQLRSEVDSIMTSGETVRKDLPALTIRESALLEGREQPWRFILSNHPDTLPQDAPLFLEENRHRSLVRSGDLKEILGEMASNFGVLSVMVEAGGQLVAELLKNDLVDECIIYLAPMITGGLPAVAGMSSPNLSLSEADWSRFGDDVRLRALVHTNQSGK
jgi:diaminohydroxyphosphoribosylaminopyrimidine deaminase/5-amino-6-(5-phosphoribosylamino)uracil reductase